jgi:hypothetical protein
LSSPQVVQRQRAAFVNGDGMTTAEAAGSGGEAPHE